MVLDITIEVKGVVKAKEEEEANLLLVHDEQMQEDMGAHALFSKHYLKKK
jgi:hypothetical protein